jgi:hypothetical protein
MTAPSTDKCHKLAKRILDRFEAGIILEEDICHFMESTFGALSLSELVRMIQEEPDFESATLIELIFYPNLSLQMDIEPILEEESFHRTEERCIVDLLKEAKPRTTLHIPNPMERAELTIPETAFDPLVSRLSITKKLSGDLIEAIHQSIPARNQNRIKVHIRNRRLHHFSSHIQFLIRFLTGINTEADFFLDSFYFVLDLLGEQKNEVDFLMILKDKMEIYQKIHHQAVRFNEQLAQHNMETLMFQGIRAPQISGEEAEKRMVLIGYIKKAVYGDGGI